MKGILFNREMVRAILDGRKTVTRRVVKNNPCECESKQLNGVCKICDDKGGFFWPDEYVKARSPYRPDDVMYVRETWAPNIEGGFFYRADTDDDVFGGWRPSIHMSREAARIFLRVMDVRVERLQDITEEQARAEGAEPLMITADIDEPDSEKRWEEALPALTRFPGLWDSTIEPKDRAIYGWEANPWVWVIEFERISKEEAERE